jgi:hypothetical protein
MSDVDNKNVYVKEVNVSVRLHRDDKLMVCASITSIVIRYETCTRIAERT